MEQILCACGCGESIDKYDNWGRIRTYKIRHFWRGKKRDDMKGSNHYNWKGGRRKDGKGYILLYMPDHPNCDKQGYIREHIFVLEGKLGRYLKKGEIPHHINGIKDDNRIDNIELLSTHKEHMVIHNTGNQYNKKDMSNRRCGKCNSNTTYINRQGYSEWRNYNQQLLCKKCYMSSYDHIRRNKRVGVKR